MTQEYEFANRSTPKTKKEIRALLIDAAADIIREELPGIIDLALDEVALQFGDLREVIKNDILLQADEQLEQGVIFIDLHVNRVTNTVIYAKYHWGVGPTGLSFYKRSTTPNTKPIIPVEILIMIGTMLKQALLLGLRAKDMIK